ncbi:MAG: lactonase family protein [Cyclobacteriaceae bacterium]|nr:lactonase family protein [Cyclobacteriaceae bacterium]
MKTGRMFYALAAVVSILFSNCTPMKTEKNSLNLLVGTYTLGESQGIYRISFDPETGRLSDSVLVAPTENPSYLALSADGKSVYSVNENEEGLVTAFRWNESGKLDQTSQLSTNGAYPCYIDAANGWVSVANYGSGNVVFYQTNDAGDLLDNPVIRQHEGKGPDSARQEGPHAHYAAFDNQAKWNYAVDLGIDAIKAYGINENGEIGEGITALQLDGGEGPRHLAFIPEKKLAFVVNELSSTVVSMAWDTDNGTFVPIQRISTLPAGFEGTSYCADVHASADGKFLYVSNRGHDSIAIFSIAENGNLSLVGTESVRGKWPRNFTLSPDNQFLLVANQHTHNVTVFAIDPATGLLSYTGNEISIDSPVCLKFY